MKKRIAMIAAFMFVVVCSFCMCVSAHADTASDSQSKVGTMTVVYLRDGGTGDGSDYANAVSTLEDAYMMLDLSKDCTIVVCDVYTQVNSRFSIKTPYTGSVTLTSCYGGYDYRTIGAKFEFDPFRFVCWGETVFKNITFHTTGTNMLVVGQHNPVTLAEGVDISGTGMTGGNIAKSFAILGGYQGDQDDPPEIDNKDTNITVMSGKYIYIVAFARQMVGTYEGTAHIKIGGTADVSVLNGSAAYHDGIYVGNVEVEVTDSAHIKNFYGVTQNTNAKSYTFNWKSGTIDNFYWVCPNTAAKTLFVEGDTVLNASAKVKAYENYSTISAQFDKLGDVAEDGAYVVPANPDTQKPGDDILKAPVTTTTPTPPSQGGNTPGEGEGEGEENKPNASVPGGEDQEQSMGLASKPNANQNQGSNNSSTNTPAPEQKPDNTLLIVLIAGGAVLVIAIVVVVIVAAKKKGSPKEEQ